MRLSARSTASTKQGHRWTVAIGLVCLLAGLTIPAQALASAGSLEIREYMNDFGVTQGQAEAKLDVQEQGEESGVVDNLRQRLGSQYAGVWFDNEAGEFVVPSLSPAGQSAITDEMAQNGLGGEFRTAPAQLSWGQLTAVKEKLDESIMSLITQGLVQTWLDPRANAVIVEIVSGIGSGDRAQIESFAAAAEDAVRIKESDSQLLGGTPMGCLENFGGGTIFICGRPLRGGVRLSPSGTTCCVVDQPYCTVGFKAVGNTYGNRFVLTAGHCVTAYADFMSFDSDQGLQGHYIGHVEAAQFPFHDYAAINANGSYWDTSPWPTQVAYWGVDQTRNIAYERPSYMGQQVCHAGARTGASCGTVTAIDKTVTYMEPGSPTVFNMTAVQGMCAFKGDSGGPVFAGDSALGIFSGSSSSSSESESEQWSKRCTYEHYYTEIMEISEELGVHVATGAGGQPYAETLDASNTSGTQTTGNGRVDPNGLPTTYRFEYGITTAYGSATESFYAGTASHPSSVSATISGLEPGTTYHYRISSSNGSGQSNGQDKTFKTTPRASPAVVVDNSGVEHIYTRSSTGQLEEWFQVGTRWSKRLWGPTGNVAGSPSAVVDPSGKIWVYFRSSKGQLRNWWFQGVNFAEEEHGYENRMGGDPAVIEDKEGKRWVYFKGPNGTLRNWWFQGVNWNEEEHGYENRVGGDPAVIEDKEGRRWVYFKGTNGTLRNWWFKGVNWNEEEHGYAEKVGGYPSAFEDKEGRRWVYFKGTNGTLRNWWFKGANWNEEEHAYANTVGGDPSAFEDTEGKRWVYFRGTNGQLKAWWFKGVNWNEEGIGAVGTISGDPKGIARPSGKREVFYFNGAGAPFRWRFGPSEAALDTLASLLPFATSTKWTTWNTGYTLILADANGDGKKDIAGRNSAGDVQVGLSTGSSFGTSSSWKTWDPVWTLQLADVNGDGKADIVGRNPSVAEVRVALSTGSSFGTATKWSSWPTTYTLQLADVNGDGKTDIVGRNSSTGDRQVGLSTGSGFQAATSWGTWGTNFTFVLADVNGDGRADTVGRESGGSQVRVGLSTGSGFSASSQWTTWNSAYSMELADVNGDGKNDIIGRGPAGDVQVGLSTASVFAASSEWTPWSNAFSTAFADVSGDGRADIIGRNSTGEVQVGLSVK